jgi:serine/threonine protein kinase
VELVEQTARRTPTSIPNWLPGGEPIPGYRLLQPLGKGGFGEVWKCEAPGGLCKAIKAVPLGVQASQERESLRRVKAIRHPFILSLERVEVVGNTLFVIMELADRNLADLCVQCQSTGLPGIPRRELLGLLLGAAARRCSPPRNCSAAASAGTATSTAWPSSTSRC